MTFCIAVERALHFFPCTARVHIRDPGLLKSFHFYFVQHPVNAAESKALRQDSRSRCRQPLSQQTRVASGTLLPPIHTILSNVQTILTNSFKRDPFVLRNTRQHHRILPAQPCEPARTLVCYRSRKAPPSSSHMAGLVGGGGKAPK